MPQRARRGREFFRDTRDLGRGVYDEVRRSGFRQDLRRSVADLYEFYVDEETRQRLARMGRLRRWMWRAAWLLRSLFEHLSPLRRALLLIALVLAFAGGSRSAEDSSWELPAAIVLLLLVLMLELKDKLLARDELELGRSIQLSLLPEFPPDLDGWDVWIYSTPANDVGGDLVDYLEIEPGRLGIFLGDVAGKGLGAALLMAKLQATLRALLSPSATGPAVVAQLNRIFCRDGIEGRFATLVQFELREGGDRARFVNAGHPPPLLVRASGVEQPEPQSLPVGVKPEETYVEQELTMAPGDVLVVFSDGVTESSNEQGEFFGESRLRSVVESLHDREAAAIGAEILHAVETFRGESRVDDDLSLVVARRLR